MAETMTTTTYYYVDVFHMDGNPEPERRGFSTSIAALQHQSQVESLPGISGAVVHMVQVVDRGSDYKVTDRVISNELVTFTRKNGGAK